MWQTLPEFGTAILYALLVTAAYTFSVGVAAGRGRPRLLQAARLGAYATSGLTGTAVVLLAYAFLSHDFRLTYVAHYSDRSMSTTYLLTSLWGGQDGSLLWWATLLAAYVTAAVRWMKGRYRQLQPYVIATLMVIVAFFAVLMLFAANPFATSVAGAPAEGRGLNPLLQNYWMIVHPPALYTGFVGCSVPFAFAVAALVTGRLDSEWTVAVRKWMLFAWLFLSIGNVLGMIWAYEELGWGGYWAWDPVENAAALPWFAATAYVHSTMIQERRNMLKLWNVLLICVTFFLTIFGTFLTRSGLIASVHSFAQSDIGIFFVWAMGLLVASCTGLIVWRLPVLRARAHIETVASREAMFVINNWAMLGMAAFVATATLYPKITEWLLEESATVGPPFFNRWMAPIGLVVFALMGLAPLFGWRKTSASALRRAVVAPGAALLLTGAVHLAFGARLGYPALVPSEEPYPGVLGGVLHAIQSVLPLVGVALVSFNIVVIAQEFAAGVVARRSAAAKRGEPESIPVALFRLVERNRRRYGGYVVHVGIVAMFLGFIGTAWTRNGEASLLPGSTYRLGDYTLTYSRTYACPGNRACSPAQQGDFNKRMVFAEIDVKRNGTPLGTVTPAKFVYHRMPDSPTTEVGLLRSWRDDLYVALGTVNPQSGHATFQFHVNPFVSWIWLGLLVLIAGATVSLWPEPSEVQSRAWAMARASAAVAASASAALWLSASPAAAYTEARGGPAEAVAELAGAVGRDQAPGAPRLAGIMAAPLLGVAVGVAQATRRRRKLGQA